MGGKPKLTIEQMQLLAEKKDGKCLSVKYINIDTKLKWECSVGHQWETIPYLIKTGYWCPKCKAINASKRQLGNIEQMQVLAKQRSGKCLSTTYTDSHTKLRWQCSYGHEWDSTPNNISSGSWCPKCASGLGERICRTFFEQLFQKKFSIAHPPWLLSDLGNPMELDGYNKELGLAFEHQGQQHYKIDGFLVKTKKELERRIKLDKLKISLCKMKNIILIQIPAIPNVLKVNDVRAFIKKECLKMHVQLPSNFDEIDIDLRLAYIPKNEIKTLQKIAKSNGGICLSDTYLGSQTKLKWQCKEGHLWQTNPRTIIKGSWCPKCAGNVKLSIKHIKSFASELGGKCLSKIYLNNRTLLEWQCKKGHTWQARYDNITKGTWCPKCSIKKRADNQRSSIKSIKNIAKKRNGKLISNEYISTHSKLTWECEYGHQWDAVPSAVRRGSWCPICTGNKKATISEMQEFAKNKNGKCLSEKYVSTHTKLLWECEKGHKWESTPSGIKRGSWCPSCAGNVKLTIEYMRELANKKKGNVYLILI